MTGVTVAAARKQMYVLIKSLLKSPFKLSDSVCVKCRTHKAVFVRSGARDGVDLAPVGRAGARSGENYKKYLCLRAQRGGHFETLERETEHTPQETGTNCS